jgi:hypothetical protein
VAAARPAVPAPGRSLLGVLVACGLAHLLALWTIWVGGHGIAGLAKAAAARSPWAPRWSPPLVPRGLAPASDSDLGVRTALRVETAARGRADQRLEFLRRAHQVGRPTTWQAFSACSAASATVDWDLGEAWVRAMTTRRCCSRSWARTAELGCASAAGRCSRSPFDLVGRAFATRRPVWIEDVSPITFG